MLVLSRKKNEKIILKTTDNKEIVITLVKIESNKVRIGIEAESDVTILREELLKESN